MSRNYNDRLGHQAGDECLRRICQMVASGIMRPGDLVARYGGEKIVFLTPTTEQRGAMMVVERIRAAVLALGIEHRDSPFGVVTISAGVASLIPIGSSVLPADLIGAANASLYSAIGCGRNRVYGGVRDEVDVVAGRDPELLSVVFRLRQ